MDFLYYPLAFLVALGVLVAFHEYGHFVVARWSGVQVIRFSIGFGPALLSRVDAKGTQFTLSAIPLGGYVRMLGEERERESAQVQPGALAYGDLTPLWRIAIALGGPLANFILAIVVYWILLIFGTFNAAPMVGIPVEDSAIAAAGLSAPSQILSVDGDAVGGWQDVGLALTDRLGESGQIVIGIKDLASNSERELQIPITAWHVDVGEPDVLGSLGIKPAMLSVAGPIVEGSAAQRAGVLAGDFFTAADGRPISDWNGLVEEIQAHPEQMVTLSLFREGRLQQVRVTPDAMQTAEGKTVGSLGVRAAQVKQDYNIVEALPAAMQETWDKTTLIATVIKKMVVGQVSVKNLSGPISIAQVAGDSARYSWRAFVGIIGFLSISLGIFNLLPIPMLDGGHILFNTAELVTGKPVPERIQIVGVQIGLFLVGTLFVFATYNDVLRIF